MRRFFADDKSHGAIPHLARPKLLEDALPNSCSWVEDRHAGSSKHLFKQCFGERIMRASQYEHVKALKFNIGEGTSYERPLLLNTFIEFYGGSEVRHRNGRNVFSYHTESALINS